MIKCVVLEDEKPAQQVLKRYITQTPFLTLLGIYESGVDIPTSVIQEAELLFLDVQLPGMNGLSFLKTLDSPPKVIVTTAYTDYAIEAFEEAVIDYLLKPFPYERFFKAVDRIRNVVPASDRSPMEHVFVYADKAFYNIQIEQILYLKAEVDYVNIVTKEKSYLILDSLKNWHEKLTGHRFVQTHRSFIVNLNQVHKVKSKEIEFESGQTTPIGNTFKINLLDSIKN